MVIVDSSVWIDLLRNADTPQVRIVEEQSVERRIGIPDLVLYEVLQGMKQASLFEAVKSRLLRFPILPTGGRELVLRAVDFSRVLRSLGIQTKLADCLIATCCIERGYPLLTTDDGFVAFADHFGLALL